MIVQARTLGGEAPALTTGAFTQAVVAVARQIAADKSPLFKTHLFVAYGLVLQPYFNIVDPDEVDPYVAAWVQYAYDQKLTFTAQAAMDAMVAAGLPADQSQEVANAMYRARQNGALNQPEVLNPSSVGQSTFQKIVSVPGSLVTGVSDAAKSTATVAGIVPWVALGLGVLAVAWVALPYLQTARAPGARARKAAR